MEESVVMSEDFLGKINEQFGLDEVDIRTYSPLTLAFIGDCVYDLIIRSILVEKGNRSVNGLHKDKSNLVNAGKQAEIAIKLSEILTEEEADIYKRGRNAKTYSHSKNSGINDYHKATGLEALIGYLYLLKRYDRILEIVKFGIENTEVSDEE